MSYRHIAAARYHRNHKLINDLFNKYVVPDTRAIITGQRMQQLKDQVQSLEKHQEKLLNELEEIEEKHDVKKKKLIDSSLEFEKEIKKVKLVDQFIFLILKIFVFNLSYVSST